MVARTNGAWRVVLEGIQLTGGDAATGLGAFTGPPDGLGLPDLRTEDVTYPQRDGVQHFSDWYEPRLITLEEVYVTSDNCPGCGSNGAGYGYGPYGSGPYGGSATTARQKVQQIAVAWGRKCEDVELVIFTDCHSDAATGIDRAINGPFGIMGRPRVADIHWVPGGWAAAVMTLRFDGNDQRMSILDPSGEPGSGVKCVHLTADVTLKCRTYPRCYGVDGMCYPTDISPSGTGPQTGTNYGTLCVRPTITLTGPLTNPRVDNLTSGESVGYRGAIDATDVITINLETGTAVNAAGDSRTHLIIGNPRMQLLIGDNELRLISFNPTDTGTADVCWRDQVEWA